MTDADIKVEDVDMVKVESAVNSQMEEHEVHDYRQTSEVNKQSNRNMTIMSLNPNIPGSRELIAHLQNLLLQGNHNKAVEFEDKIKHACSALSALAVSEDEAAQFNGGDSKTPLEATFKLLAAVHQGQFSSNGQSLLIGSHMVMCISTIEVAQAKYADQAFTQLKVLHVAPQLVSLYASMPFGNELLATLVGMTQGNSLWLASDPGAASRAYFYGLGQAQQAWLDAEFLPRREFATHAAKSITFKLFDTHNARQYRVMVDSGCRLPFRCFTSKFFYASVQNNAEDLECVLRGFEAIVRAKCFEVFLLQLFSQLYNIRAEQHAKRIDLDGSDPGFQVLCRTGYELLSLVAKSVIQSLSEKLNADDVATVSIDHKGQWLQKLKQIPPELQMAEEQAWVKLQHWRACVPQLQLYHHEGIKDGTLGVNDLWKFHQEGARRQGLRDELYFENVLSNNSGPNAAWKNNVPRSLQLPDTSNDEPITELLKSMAEVFAWQAGPDQTSTLLTHKQHKKRKA